ncbi:MAG TPA: transglycosylase domain-containing protein [Dehalococcoidia bacterium]|nr:transglycosylase domain-containing protein [Dehalococcoidia bacterium]
MLLKVAIGVALLAVVVVGVVAASGVIVYDSYANDLLAPDELAINQPSYGAVITDRNGQVLYEYVDDKAGLRRPTKLEDVSPNFLAATVATEDNSFFTNPGININGLGRAVFQNAGLGGGDVFGGGGGSSITQQLVKNVYISEEARQERFSKEGIDRKVKEIVYALELTQKYSKDQILEWYVNQISYGGVYNGVEAAAEGYFGKSAKDLTLAEAAQLAGIPQSPAAYDPINQPEASLNRRNEVLDLMLRQGHIQVGENKFVDVSEADIEAAKAEPSQIAQARFSIEAPHWVLSYIEPQLRALLGCPQLIDLQREVIAGTHDPLKGRPGEGCPGLFTEGLHVTTSLDLDLQNQTQAIMEKYIEQFEGQSNSHNGSMMVMDPKTGEILVMIGSRDYNNEEIEGKNNNATACNSPGSSFKPFAYITAFEKLGWGPGTIVLDTPVSYPGGPGQPDFRPENPLHNFAGPVTIRFALGNSLNVPPVKTAATVGPQNIVVEARKLGFVDSFRVDGCSSGGYGPAIATGGVDVTLEEMMYGYSVLASDGIMRGQQPLFGHDSDERQMDPVSLLKVVDNKDNVLWDINQKHKEQQVIDPAYPYLVWSILSDVSATCVTFNGCISIPGYKAGLKTGTSEPYNKDDPSCVGKIGETWAFGFSPDVVVGIWAGNSDNSCVTDIVSTSIAFRAVRDTFQMTQAGKPQTPYPQPDDVVEAEVCVPSGLKPTDLCGKKTKDLFAKKDVPTEDDTWWQRIKVDVRNGNLAGPRTPQEFTVEKTMLVVPPEWVKTEDDKKKAQEWAQALGIELAPTEISDGSGTVGGGSAGTPSSSAAIYSPGNGNNVTGTVQIIGRAASGEFKGYRLEYGEGPNPSKWTKIQENDRAQNGGTLGIWNVSELPPGQYSLRLVVEDASAPDAVASVVVTVPGASLTPTPQP